MRAPCPVDVVVPLHDGAPWIEETLAGVLAQVAPLGDVFVVDDRSSDEGPERVRRLPAPVRLLRSDEPFGARRVGTEASRSALVAFVDQDDALHPEHLAGLAEVLARHPEAAAAVSTILVFPDGEAPRHARRSGPVEVVDPWATWPYTCPISTPSSVLFRRSALDAAGGWRPEVVPDWELYLRIARHGAFVRTPDATCAYRRHADSESAALRRDARAYLALMARAVAASYANRLAAEGDRAADLPLARRRAGFRDYRRFLRAVLEGRRGLARRAARAYEASLEGEPDAWLAQIFPHTRYLLGSFEMDRVARAVPRDAPRVRRVFSPRGRAAGA